ncbi:MAG: sigma-54 dependent transcriptional regulator [Candidatus Zixiibacteriota bacterium]
MESGIPKNILIVDDDFAVRTSLRLLFKQAGYRTFEAEGPDIAKQIVTNESPHLIILDMNFSRQTTGEEGLLLLNELRGRTPLTPIILITAWGSIPLAVEGMKAGAVDFITKPWENDVLLQSVETALQLKESTSDAAESNRAEIDKRYDFSGLVGDDPALVAVLQQAGRVAATAASVLITGESGVGKELLAEAIHNNSNRADGPFVKVNLGGVPSSLFESELFGHVKGAFTGAVRDRVGRFQAANGGTIFLDEIGDLDSANQVKLLRVLQDHSFEPLGSDRTQSVDFRLVSATNRDLPSMVADGNFREDLFYRINLITLRLPALKERVDDIPLLVERFVRNLREIYDRPTLQVSPDAIEWLKGQTWPGNVRELKNLVERTVLVSTDEILHRTHFQTQYQTSGKPTDTVRLPAVGAVTMDELEKLMIEKALSFHKHNMSKVARSLGLSRGALYRRLEKHGLGA